MAPQDKNSYMFTQSTESHILYENCLKQQLSSSQSSYDTANKTDNNNTETQHNLTIKLYVNNPIYNLFLVSNYNNNNITCILISERTPIFYFNRNEINMRRLGTKIVIKK